ncbi:MAG: hypothetical protein L6Q95_00645 [Planctomycetes bacterium]|nr:hypothetical protein [Planctomycetota bacterium]
MTRRGWFSFAVPATLVAAGFLFFPGRGDHASGGESAVGWEYGVFGFTDPMGRDHAAPSPAYYWWTEGVDIRHSAATIPELAAALGGSRKAAHTTAIVNLLAQKGWEPLEMTYAVAPGCDAYGLVLQTEQDLRILFRRARR